MSIPTSVIVLIAKLGDSEDILIDKYTNLVFIVTGIFFFVGIGVLTYVVNLRFDVVLYARVVNAIRKHFYDSSKILTNIKIPMRVLPQSPYIPAYLEKTYFWPVVFVFWLMDSIYGSFAVYVLYNDFIDNISFMIAFLILSLILHLIVYAILAYHREYYYLRKNAIGIDIDGVLNNQCENFCIFLRKHTGKTLDPDEIIQIPVHEQKTLNVSKADEEKVFNDPEYWLTMKLREKEIVKNLYKLKNSFQLKIYIFTHRPWPQSINKETHDKARKDFWDSYNGKKKIHKIINAVFRKFGNSNHSSMYLLSKSWLKKNIISYDKFKLEKVSDYASYPRVKYKNRFVISRKKRMRFFVEDDLEKAIKLSFICDLVFLINHPYNLPNPDLPKELEEIRKQENIPSNIIRVNNWDEIYQIIRRVL